MSPTLFSLQFPRIANGPLSIRRVISLGVRDASSPTVRDTLPRRLHSVNNITSIPSAADEFLSTIMRLPAPMSEDVMEDIVEGVVTRPAASKQARASVGRQNSEEMEVDGRTVRDPTDPRPHGLQFKICLSSADSIRLAAFHETADLPLFLGACAPVQQFAKLAPEEDQDTDAFNQIAIHMKQRSFFTYAHLYLDETAVALLIVFSPGSEDVCKLLRVPLEVMDGVTLTAALVPWELTAKEFWGLDWRVRSSSTEGILDTALEDTIRNAGRKLTDKRAYYQGLHILGFPKTLHDFMSTSKQTFCIWCSAVDSTQKDPKDPGYETWLLRQILSVYNGRDVGYKADVRVIFVHVGALSTFHKLPALAERRLKRPDIRYMTYGTHESVPRNRWGIREIYPFGGVITFTPSAILQESFSIFKFIRKVEKHPLWDCYVLPSVVAMVAKLTCQGEHPLTLYDRGEFVFDELLQLIEEGSISLVQAPPLDSVRDDKPWIGEALKMSCLDARGILDECIKIAVQQYRDISEADLPLAIEQQIARDIGSMQLQPAIMDKYRRFVVIKGRADRHFKEDKDGYESADLSSFDFRDDFYKA
ncbi:hypothetical protein A0H81_00527 [Grifola frondosa]|uniref:Uncharacterized protein n=1 Tax=Grifola frondosa TaxID=5627 RepID=A0A1C7MTS6_GRIFR|nr:hypothetical protein A0H81_00527 [Grifola frondosa]